MMKKANIIAQLCNHKMTLTTQKLILKPSNCKSSLLKRYSYIFQRKFQQQLMVLLDCHMSNNLDLPFLRI